MITVSSIFILTIPTIIDAAKMCLETKRLDDLAFFQPNQEVSGNKIGIDSIPSKY